MSELMRLQRMVVVCAATDSRRVGGDGEERERGRRTPGEGKDGQRGELELQLWSLMIQSEAKPVHILLALVHSRSTWSLIRVVIQN